jgi:hypothetical protein
MFDRQRVFAGILFCFLVAIQSAGADEIAFAIGAGSQPGSDQRNKLISLDYIFADWIRSPRSTLSLGIGYSQLKSNTDTNARLKVFSVFPQLTLTPASENLSNYYFFVRALGPSYISENTFGERKQDNHFTFQAQVGVGFKKDISIDESILIQVSWKHFSNVNLFSDNDGIDIPLVVSIGYKF